MPHPAVIAAPLTPAAGDEPSRALQVTPRLFLATLAVVVPLLVACTWIFYRMRWAYTQPWIQPVMMAAVLGVFFAAVQRFTGRSFLRDFSRDGKIVVLGTFLLLTVLWLYGRNRFFDTAISPHVPRTAFSPLYSWFYFSINCVLFRMVAPLLILRFVLRKSPAEFGYRLRGTFDLAWVYLLLFVAIALVVVFWASREPSFLARYPMCRAMIRGGSIPWWQFLLYQLTYGAVFVSGESLWRGYLIFGLERDLGRLALIFMIIPYTMVHFGKPFPETLGAIVAGLVLGYLALRHRSFWLGVATHWGVALTMDVSALVRRGISLSF